MKTSIDERISALVDGESGEFETRRLTGELLTSETHKSRWSRYHLIGDAMRDDLPPRIEPGFSAGVMAMINEDLPGYDSTLERRQSPWLKPIAGLAIAASVAVVSVLVLQSLTSQDSAQPKMDIAEAIPAPTLPTAVRQGPKATPVAVVKSAVIGDDNQAIAGNVKTLEARIVDSRMNSYLATHAEYATQPIIMPQVRVVGFE